MLVVMLFGVVEVDVWCFGSEETKLLGYLNSKRVVRCRKRDRCGREER